MASLFSKLREYGGSWEVVDSKPLDKKDIAETRRAEVVPSQYGNSICFHLKTGGMKFVPCGRDCDLEVGDEVDPKKVVILELERGDETCYKADVE
jgi:hypothetical protein